MGEIKISDLSIGDWVRHTFYEDNLQIKRIDGECERLLAEKGLMSVSCHLDHFEPIPLTPEILEKNGWLPPRKAIELDTWWWTNGVDKAIEAYEYEGEWYLTIIEQKEIQYRNRVGIGLKYVHQLQHALRLAGVEKNIEL